MKKVGIIIPTIRENNINEFLRKWDFPDYCRVFVMEDNPVKEFTLSKDVHFHGSWEDFEDLKDSWIFSKKCGGGIRSFGFYKAFLDGCNYFITLDDDCLPTECCNGTEFVEAHIKQLETNNGKWLWTTTDIRPRGVPYRNIGDENETLINMGFWKKNADFDACTQLAYGSVEAQQNVLNPIPKGYYASICGMNLSFKAKAIPLMFQPLMGEDYEIWRFDDIWFGIIAKKICDHLNFSVRAGGPSIVHSRASNVWSNLRKEVNGLEMNESFWKMIDDIELKGETIHECYLEIADVLLEKRGTYFHTLGSAMTKWVNLFRFSL